MTQRERRASGRATEAVARPPSGLEPPRPETAPGRVPLWEEIFGGATPAQQAELLSLARGQGLLYAHQLPAVRNGTPAAAERARQLLNHVFGGQVDELDPVPIGPVEFLDTALDAAQRDAVLRAVHSPDLCLIDGLPGTGKSRVVAEIVAQAAAQGERVLVLAATPPALDRVLEIAGGREAVCAVRCLGATERIEELPPASAALTFRERLRCLQENSLAAARQEATASEQRCQQLRQDQAVLDQLLEFAGHQAQLEEQITALQMEAARIRDAVEREAAGEEPNIASHASQFRTAMAALVKVHGQQVADHEQTRAKVRHQQEELRRDEEVLAGQIDHLRPVVEAKQQGRWLTGAFWKATLRGNVAAELAALEERRQQLQAERDKLDQESQRLDEESHQAEMTFQLERLQLIDTECARRRVKLDDQETALRQEKALLLEKWQGTCRNLASDEHRPQAMTPEAVQTARASWRQHLQREEEQAAFARQWITCLEETAGTLPARLANHVNLVAATTSALAGDAHFGDQSGRALGYDLLVLQEAERITESEFLNLARRARRWVLVATRDGEGRGDPEAARPSERAKVARVPALPRRPVAASSSLRPGFFAKLWQHLHCDIWVRDKDRLCCRLRPLPSELRQWVESERVADFPDIELRILTLPRSRPLLAEVVFPVSMTIYQAKQYIYRELEEVPVPAALLHQSWSEEPGRLVLHLGAAVAGVVPVALGPGIRERVATCPEAADGKPCRAPWQTCALDFDQQAGWDRTRAEAWVRDHLGVRDLARTARLTVPHRMHPDLANFVGDLLFRGEYHFSGCFTAELPAPGQPAVNRNGSSARVEFVPVPSLNAETGPRKPGDAESRKRPEPRRPVKGGAGLELDLSDPRHRDRLPTEFRPGLPERGGFVNYLEAQAVVRRLEGLAGDPVMRGLVEQGRLHGCKPVVAVMAPYVGQVELIRCLIRQTQALAHAAFDLALGVPADFGEREFPVVLLSLTRSHHHRAVCFGDDPHGLALALTRPRAKLVLFGDLGTLIRRSQWEGSLDHLDDAAAAREREVIAHLVDYLQGHGRYPRAFLLHEGAGP